MSEVFVAEQSLAQTVRRALYEIRVRREIHRAQSEINRAFAPPRLSLADNRTTMIALAATGFLALGVASYAITSPVAPPTLALTTVPVAPVVAPVKPMEPVTPVTPDKIILAPDETLPPQPFTGPDLFDLPSPGAELPAIATEAPYVLLIDKKGQKLYVLEESKDNYRVVTSYSIATGAKAGDKFLNGDLRTPEGVYRITRFMEDAELPDSYGPGAFVLNYPNSLDKKEGKTGYGIWIHGSGLGSSRAPTEGCVETNDFDIVDLEKYAGPKTPVLIYPGDYAVPVVNNVVQKNLIRSETVYGVKEWYATAETQPDETSGVN